MRYSSAGASGTASGAASGAASGTTTTGAVSVTQVVTLSISASQYTGNMKTLMETAYGMALGIYDTANSAYFTGCSVTSSAARRSASVTFVAQVSSTKSAAAQASANALTPTSLNAAVLLAKAALGSAYSSLTVSVTGVAAPQIASSSTSGAGHLTLSLLSLAVVGAALRH